MDQLESWLLERINNKSKYDFYAHLAYKNTLDKLREIRLNEINDEEYNGRFRGEN